MILFTINSRNFLAYTQVLYDSLRLHHPDSTFYLVLADSAEGIDAGAFPFPVVGIDSLALPGVDTMAAKYNITEFNTAVKPFAFLELFRRHPGEFIVYLDPDMYVTSEMTELATLINSGVDCVLTPHITEPSEHGEWIDQRALQFGINNLGFCGLRHTEDVERIVWWWARRLAADCVIDLSKGLFVDQKWADLLPAFIDNTRLLRHPGYNVGYWNLTQRRVQHVGGEWRVNAYPLRLVHFSGNVIEDPTVFSRHSQQLHLGNIGDLRMLLDEYRAAISNNGQRYYLTFPYAFGWQGTQGENLHTPQALGEGRSAFGGANPHLSLSAWQDRRAYEQWRASNPSVDERRWDTEVNAIPGEDVFHLEGFCIVCRTASMFRVSGMYSSRRLPDGRTVPNWREHLDCHRCGLVTRLRAAVHVLEQLLQPSEDASIYITEQVTPLYRILAERYVNIVGSEYVGDEAIGIDGATGVRHEDVQRLSFADESFDYVLSFDVLEHVPLYPAALSELRRVLRPNGQLLMSAPFDASSQDHEVRAVLDDEGRLRHLLEPEYHGNPMDHKGGSLAYRKFGWRLLNDLNDAGFSEARVLTYWSELFRYFGNPGVLFLAKA